MWCQVEIETDGGILGRISPFVAMSLVPHMTSYHNKFVVRRVPSATLGKNATDG